MPKLQRLTSGDGGDIKAHEPIEAASPDSLISQHSIGILQPHQETGEHVQYRVYKRRFFGLAQLVLLNIIVSVHHSAHD